MLCSRPVLLNPGASPLFYLNRTTSTPPRSGSCFGKPAQQLVGRLPTGNYAAARPISGLSRRLYGPSFMSA